MKKTLLALIMAGAAAAQAQPSNVNIDDFYWDGEQQTATAQDPTNPLSVRPVGKSRIMYQKQLVRSLNLRMKPNLPLFAEGKELPAFLLEALEQGCLNAYENEKFQTALSFETVKEKLKLPGQTPEDTAFMTDWEKESYVQPKDAYFSPRELYDFEITENVFFDKQRSKWVYDIQFITMYIPADNAENEKGYRIPVATFKFKECAECFNKNPNAVWFNTKNDSEHRRLTDAFDLRLFYSQIVKISGPKDEYLADRYPGDAKKGIMVSDWEEKKLHEFESNLYEN